MRSLDSRAKIIKKIYKSVQSGVPERECLKKFRDIIQDIPDFNIRDKARLYLTVKYAVQLMYIQDGKLYKEQIKKYSRNYSKALERKDRRGRKQNLVENLRNSRAAGRIFYLCSWHTGCAEGHKQYQGRIYVDRFWRSILGYEDESVLEYIRKNEVMTVQEVCSDPVYMITRPYCRHYFISLDTDTVLAGEVDKRIGRTPSKKFEFNKLVKKIQDITSE